MTITIGVELEGGWDMPKEHLRDLANVSVTRDGSVTVRANGFVGEVYCTNPYKTLGSLRRWLTDSWPDVVNESCGFHVHFGGFSVAEYSALTDRKFYDSVVRRLREWGRRYCENEPEFWNRLGGSNRFCSASHHPDEQIMLPTKGGARYTQINYCWRLHGTLEFRVLPMFNNRDLAILAVALLLDEVNTHLAQDWNETVDASVDGPGEERAPPRHLTLDLPAAVEAIVEAECDEILLPGDRETLMVRGPRMRQQLLSRAEDAANAAVGGV